VYLDVSKVTSPKGVSYSRVLLRSSYREDGKIKHRTLGNLSSCSPEEVDAVRLALKHKDKLASLLVVGGLPPNPKDSAAPHPSAPDPDEPFVQGPSVGAIAVLHGIAEQLGITAALGDDASGRLALWQVIARALDQGSRLSAVRLARDLGAASILDLPAFDEDALYTNLAWLEDRQERIETELFEHRYADSKPELYLYDVTSTYLEGEHNALAAFGYNRDGKRGKKQIVVGLLCDGQGVPVAIEAFKGNTPDTKTVSSQIVKLQGRFHAGHITLVGDRGMLRGPQIEELAAAGLHYITAISKPQIETLLKSGVLQMALFDQALGEVIVPHECGNAAESGAADPSAAAAVSRSERYILRRNPVRQTEMAASRTDKEAALRRSIVEANGYLKEHARAKVTTAHIRIEKRLKTLGLGNWASLTANERELRLTIDVSALAEESKLDGCYVLRTDLSPVQADKERVHDRYKGLSEVEQAFRRGKTVELELRPVHVRKASSTRGHLLVVMLAYLIMKELGRRWAGLDMQVGEGLDRLNTYCAVEVAGVIQVLLQPRADVQSLLDAAAVSLPARLPGSRADVATRKKLPKHRPTRMK
jgi:hypothetical protein